MVEKVKIEPKIITIHEGRPAFYKPEPQYRYDEFGKEINTRPDGSPVKKRASMTWLIDPSNKQGAETIKEIKAEGARQLDLFFGGRDKWPKDNEITGTKGIILCFGDANKLPKVYDGYRDMFFVKVSDTTPPIIGDRRGRQVVFLSDNAWHVVDREATKAKGMLITTEETVDPSQVPYGGCYARGRISLYVYSNKSSGVNANFKGVQFVRPGEAFGGGTKRNAEEELMAMAGDAAPTTAPSEEDPF